MTKLLRWYFQTSLMLRIVGGFILGSSIGIVLWIAGVDNGGAPAQSLAPYISPFGAIFVQMLKMAVIPVVFVTLVCGASALPIRRFGRIGVKVIAWYLLTSLFAAVVGVILALALNPGAGLELGSWKALASGLGDQASELAVAGASGASLIDIFLNLFRNPFEALATGNFLPMIVFAILFGLGIRVLIEANEAEGTHGRFEAIIEFFEASRDVLFKIVDWILEYAPIGVFALSMLNFGLYGHAIVGPYVQVVVGVVVGILVMIIVVYGGMVFVVLRENPFKVFPHIRRAMLTAFVTRSSAATLPVSLKVARLNLKVRREVSSFSLPLGSTINMDGVCVHLPFFAVLSANLFDFTLTPAALFLLVITTVLAAIGAGGVPGGSLMLMFIILDGLGMTPDQVAVIVALALGVNPILDMFETMNNVTGDLVCTYVVASKEGLLQEEGEEEAA
ncbi:MAG: dicarboxylate/amino acid:cation symporter [bacterium]|nr:dicarboxylate/amino acid:cation symporter [bacterium]